MAGFTFGQLSKSQSGQLPSDCYLALIHGFGLGVIFDAVIRAKPDLWYGLLEWLSNYCIADFTPAGKEFLLAHAVIITDSGV